MRGADPDHILATIAPIRPRIALSTCFSIYLRSKLEDQALVWTDMGGEEQVFEGEFYLQNCHVVYRTHLLPCY